MNLGIALLALQLACAPRARVVQVPYTLPVATREASDQASRGLVHDLDRGRLVEVHREGRLLTRADLLALPEGVAVAAYSVSARPRGPRHFDLWAPLPHGERRAVSVSVASRVVALAWGPASDAPAAGEVATPLGREAVTRRFGLSGVTDGDRRWSSTELSNLDEALARVESEALVALSGVTFVRMASSPRAPARELAWFDPRTEPPRIDVYDLAFDAGSGTVGPIEDLVEPSVVTLVHELAHALADWPLRQAWQRLQEAPPEEVRSRKADVKRLGGRGPVIEAWADVRDGPGPTDYGRRRLHESFAEAYALHRLDPDALRAVMPEAAAWFDAGGHLRAAGLAPADDGR